jgi:hypothetical protein
MNPAELSNENDIIKLFNQNQGPFLIGLGLSDDIIGLCRNLYCGAFLD